MDKVHCARTLFCFVFTSFSRRSGLRNALSVFAQVVATLYRGSYFGERAIITNEPRAASVQVLRPQRVGTRGRRNYAACGAICETAYQCAARDDGPARLASLVNY